MKKYSIPCKHETGEVYGNEEHPDFYPLTKQEITELVHVAQNADARTKASVQVRLNQGIPGMTCPRPIDGEVSDRMNRMDEYYVRNLAFYGRDPSFVDELYEIMQVQQ